MESKEKSYSEKKNPEEKLEEIKYNNFEVYNLLKKQLLH